MAQGDSPSSLLAKGQDVLVRGRIAAVYGDHAEVTFARWWPRWSAVLVRTDQIQPVPGRGDLPDETAAA